MDLSPEKQLELIRAHTIDLLPEEELLKKLRSGRPLRVKLGVDPTGPDIHLGHAVVLRKLRLFQDLGHTAVLIIGDYTGLIGDPSGRNEGRPQLTREQIVQNMATYREQVFKILADDPEKIEFHYNSEWLAKLTPELIIRLMATHTAAQVLAREDFAKRYAEQAPISLHELLYPIFQGYDSVAIRADVELGGTEQKFNLLVGRELQVRQNNRLDGFLRARVRYEEPRVGRGYRTPPGCPEAAETTGGHRCARLTEEPKAGSARARVTSRLWGELLHGGAGAEALRDWLARPEHDAKLHRFSGQYSKWLQKKKSQALLAPVLPLTKPILAGLKNAFDPNELFGVNIAIRNDDRRRFGGEGQPEKQPPPPPLSTPQVIITFPILVGTDGVKRMGKSLGNYIGLNEPPDDMFGKVMSIPDELIEQYLELCVGTPDPKIMKGMLDGEIKQLVADMKSGALNPRDAKRRLGREIVTLYHSAEAATAADETFLRVFSGARQQTREDYEAVAEEVAIPDELRNGPVWISTVLAALGLAKSKGEATRLVKGGGVYVDERRVADPQEEVKLAAGMILRVGKRRVVRLR